MDLTLSTLFKNAEKTYGLKLIAGKDGMENTVRWVHMVEDTEVPDFLHGNELVFTTGIANHQANWLLYFVKNLRENNASGVVINLGPYIESIPPQVIVYCEQNDFPIFTIPWETRIIDITYHFCRIIINNEKQEQSLTETFKNLIINPDDKDGYLKTLERTGFSDSSKYMVLVVDFVKDLKCITEIFLKENDAKITKYLRLNSLPKAMFIWNKKLILVYQNLALSAVKTLTEKLEFLCKENEVRLHIGVSDISKSFKSVSLLYNQAQSALKIAKIQKTSIVKYQEIGIYKILLEIKNKDVLKAYLIENIGLLIKHDKEHNSDLCNTLRKYCEAGGSVHEMAEFSGVHRNTINYKMKKIKEILGIELNYANIMNIMLSFNISDILN